MSFRDLSQAIRIRRRTTALTMVALSVVAAAQPQSTGPNHRGDGPPASRRPEPRPPAAVVTDIVRADYEGDRAALKRLLAELAAPAGSNRDAALIRYWRGFASWRRAINGYADAVDRAELVADLEQAIAEFEQAVAVDPRMTDAKAGMVACAGLLAGLSAGDAARVASLSSRYRSLVVELTAATAPANPRVLWVVGLMQWSAPSGASPDVANERQARAMATYERGLALVRAQDDVGRRPLQPAWGEPELLMNLAWSHLNKTMPDVERAEQYARAALALVPHWHYVRDVLMPQIQKRRLAPDWE